MGIPQRVEQVRKLAKEITLIDQTRLISRPEWGPITFEAAKHDLDRIFNAAGDFTKLPIEVIPDQQLENIRLSLERAKRKIESLNGLDIERAGSTAVRNSILSELRSHSDDLLGNAAPWIPYLLHQSGEAKRRLSELDRQIVDASKRIDAGLKELEEKQRSIDAIIVKSREAAASTGAAVFSSDFRHQANDLNSQAKTWLFATAIFSVATLLTALLLYFYSPSIATHYEAFQRISGKIAILGILLTASIWCGRIYKALMHQSAIYRFKALGLQTFQAFHAGSSDDRTKDAVLMETTRSIFTNNQTGFISDNATSETKVIEVLKSVMPKGGE